MIHPSSSEAVALSLGAVAEGVEEEAVEEG